MEKLVSQLDRRGYFIGAVVADPSPLEEGVFLIPGGAVDVEPPTIPDGKDARWDGGWVFEVKAIPDNRPAEANLTTEEALERWREDATVSRFQARASLYQANLLDDVESYMAMDSTDFFSKLAWNEAAEFKRTSPLAVSIGLLLGLTPEQLDDLFRFASTISA